jgi:hypothetical protein
MVRRALFLLNNAYAMSILDLIFCAYFASFVIMLPKIFEIFHIPRLLLIYHNPE